MRSITRRSAVAGIGAAALTLGRSKNASCARITMSALPTPKSSSVPPRPTADRHRLTASMVRRKAPISKWSTTAAGSMAARSILISLDNAFSPPKAVEQTRKLVESDEVFAIAGFLGTPPNAAVSKYLNAKGVPSLFLTSGAVRFNDPKNFRWIVPFYPSYVAQGAVFGRYLLKTKPNGKIAVQYVNDDLGRDYLRGLKLGLGARASEMIVKEISHEMTEPTIESQIVECKVKWRGCLRPVERVESSPRRPSARWRAWAGNRRSSSTRIPASVGATLVPAGLDNVEGPDHGALGKECYRSGGGR